MRSWIGLFLSRTFLLQRWVLWALFWANLAGTVYGFEWYWTQLVYTWESMGQWLVWFVPDSPTASLFFTIALVFLLADGKGGKNPLDSDNRTSGSLVKRHGRALIEALAVVTLFKYGVWAVIINLVSGYQGVPLDWQNYMLIASHGSMAIEGLLFARFFTYRLPHVAWAALWTLNNDWIDYGFGVFPGLPDQLLDDLPVICPMTIMLGLLGIFLAVILRPKKAQSRF